jgi:hypothetical protein
MGTKGTKDERHKKEEGGRRHKQLLIPTNLHKKGKIL